MIKGIHILSTAPSSSFSGANFSPDSLEVASIVLSALLWKKYNGTIRLYTDTSGASFFERNQLLDLWDGGVDLSVIESMPTNINQHVFWAAAKIFALKDAKAPVAMIDNDLFIWKELPESVINSRLSVLHPEELWDCYVPKEKLSIPHAYSFNEAWDWEVKPFNTAFAFFSDEHFKNDYAFEAIRFMTNNPGTNEVPSSQMVFAEQRILAMCAKAQNVPVCFLAEDPFELSNKLFTHIWGAKAVIRNNPNKKAEVLNAVLLSIKELSEYYFEIIKSVTNT
jgi:hypothetical protein